MFEFSPATVAIALTGVVIIAFALVKPHAVLPFACLLVLLANTKFRSRSAGAMLAGEIDSQIWFELGVYAFILILVMRCFFAIRKQSLRLTIPELSLAAYVGLAVASTLWAPFTTLTLVRSGQLAILLALALVSARIFPPAQLLRITAWSVSIYTIFFAAMAYFVPEAVGSRMTYGGVVRFGWYSVHPLLAATFAGTAALFWMNSLLLTRVSTSRISQLRDWAAIFVLLLILLATHSRGPLFAFCLGSFVLLGRRYLFGHGARLAFVNLAVGSGVAALLLGFLVWEAESFTALLSGVFLRGDAMESLAKLSGRTDLWKKVGELFLERPGLGHGYLASRSELLAFFPWAGQAHNGIAESLLNLGILGTALLWLPFGYVLHSSLRGTLITPFAVAGDWALICALTVFLLANAMIGDSIAGGPSYEALLFFYLLAACEQQKQASWPRDRMSFAPGRMVPDGVPIGHHN